MNSDRRIHFKTMALLSMLIVSGLIVSACGGGSGGGDSSQSAGIGGTGINVGKGVVQGRVTGFGSIYVNGAKFDTDSSQFIVDGNTSASQDDLEVGMIVTLGAETENGVYTGKALDVVYDDEIEGPIAATPGIVPNPSGTEKTIKVFGQTIIVSDTTTLFKDTSFSTIAVNDLIEVSGYRVSPNMINATYIKKTGELDLGKSEVELRGVIENLSTGAAPSFEIDGVMITTDGFTQIEVPNGVLAEGQYVEVEGIIQAALSVYAEEIEFEEDGFGDEVDEVSLEGVIANYTSIADFEIDGQPIDASQASLEPSNAAMLLDDGVTVEVEGDIVAGVLMADELEVEEGSAELRSFVGIVNTATGQFSVLYSTAGSILVRTDSQTAFEDEAGSNPLANFTIFDLNTTDYVKVEGREVNGEVVANTVKRTDTDDSLKLKGEVTAYTRGATGNVTILGVVYQLAPATDYDPDDNFAVGDTVQIEDEDDSVAADGIADSVEVDN
jgi:hypothetical protein